MRCAARSRFGAALLAGAVAVGCLTAGAATGARRTPAQPAALDSSFGSHGIVTLGRGYQLFSVAVQPDGRLVVAGEQRQRGGIRLAVARLTSSGQLDRSFNHGRVELGPLQSTGGSTGQGVAVQRDGKIVVGGFLTDRTGIAQEGMLAERFNSTGGLDRSFGSGGVATVLGHTAQSAAYALAVQSDGKVVLAGTGPGSDGYARIALARLDSRGHPDRRFRAGGVSIADATQDLGRNGLAAAVALQPGGKIIIAGSFMDKTLQVTNAIVARFSSGGSLDRGFGSAGSFTVPGSVLGAAGAQFRAVTIGRDGSIVAAGAAASNANGTPAYALAARLSGNGRPIRSFGPTGIVALQSDRGGLAPSPLPGANAVSIAKSGIIVLAGSFQDSGRTEVGLWSLTSRGSVVPSGSSHTILPGSLGSGGANGLAIDQRGGIVIAGASNNFVSFNGFGLRYRGFGP